MILEINLWIFPSSCIGVHSCSLLSIYRRIEPYNLIWLTAESPFALRTRSYGSTSFTLRHVPASKGSRASELVNLPGDVLQSSSFIGQFQR